jgi:hypothetical protein
MAIDPLNPALTSARWVPLCPSVDQVFQRHGDIEPPSMIDGGHESSKILFVVEDLADQLLRRRRVRELQLLALIVGWVDVLRARRRACRRFPV